MIVCIEGPNGAGKSTLVDYLSNKYDLTVKHSNHATENTLDYHLKLIEEGNVICDRYNLGEIIYPIIYARKSKMTYQEHETLFKKLEELNALFIIFIDSVGKELHDRLFSRGDEEKVLTNSVIENDLFIAVDNYLEKKYKDLVVTIDIDKVRGSSDLKDSIRFIDNVISAKCSTNPEFKADVEECEKRANSKNIKE